MNEERARRIGDNETLYRQVNERIEDVNEAFGSITGDFAIVCECGEIECVQPITVSREVYERVRSNPHHFIVVPGHEESDVEEPVDRSGTYIVVEKRARIPKEMAEDSDPRS